MKIRFFLIGAIVLLLFAGIAATATALTFLTVGWPVWACFGLVSWALDQLFHNPEVST